MPLVISVTALVWIFRLIDGFVGPYLRAMAAVADPGSRPADHRALRAARRHVATNVLGKRLLQRGENYLMRVPVFRTIYAPVKQLVVAFSPDNEYGFKRVAIIEDSARGFCSDSSRRNSPSTVAADRSRCYAIYVPTNHLYLGDVIVYPRERVSFPDIIVEQGIRIFLTGGMALPGRLRLGTDDRLRRVRVGAVGASKSSPGKNRDDAKHCLASSAAWNWCLSSVVRCVLLGR